MRHEHDNARRHAENTIAEANRHLDSGKIRNPRNHQMLVNMIKEATDTLNNLDQMDARPYTDTHIGYDADMRRRRYADDVVDDAMDALRKILPRLDDDDREMRRVRTRRIRTDRYDDRYDDDDDRYNDDDDRIENMPRWRSSRTGRFLPNLYGPRRTRRTRRRSEMDDRYDDRYDDKYDDDRYDDERRMDDARRMDDDARRATTDDRTDRTDDADDAYRTRRPGPRR